MPEQFLIGVQKVELLGGESWLEHNSVAIAAIGAAVLAALVAVLNRRAQLKHDRLLRNRDHIRNVIDDSIVAANEMRIALDTFVIDVTTFEDHRSGLDPSAVHDEEDSLVEKREMVLNLLQSMRAAQWRLEIRLEDGDPVLKTYASTLSSFATLLEGVHAGIRENRPTEAREEDERLEEEIERCFSSFQIACREWLSEQSSSRISRWLHR